MEIKLKDFRLTAIVFASMIGLYFAIGLPISCAVSTSYRMDRFDVFKRRVTDDGGIIRGESLSGLSVESVVLAESTPLEDLDVHVRYAMAGHVDTFDLSRTSISWSEAESIDEWSLLSVDQFVFPDQ